MSSIGIAPLEVRHRGKPTDEVVANSSTKGDSSTAGYEIAIGRP